MNDFIYIIKGKQQSIAIPIQCKIRSDDFLALEIQNYWQNHARTCEACGVFFDDLLPDIKIKFENIKWWPIENWIVKIEGDYYQLMSNNFSTNSHYDNSLLMSNGIKTECKLKIEKFNISKESLKTFEESENYEICQIIKDELSENKNS